METEIIRGSLPEDTKIKLVYLPFARLKVSLSDGGADAVTPVNENAGIKGVYYSGSHITYQNIVVSLRSRALKITSIADLGKLRIIAFQDATVYLGNNFAAMAKNNPHYHELADQKSQVKMLFADRADAIVMDINIYKYFKNQIKDFDVSKEVSIAEIFTSTFYKVGFNSKETADAFNVGLAKLKSSGKYAAIVNKYTQ
jgi:polar amino acid transport system substrate-binding protein